MLSRLVAMLGMNAHAQPGVRRMRSTIASWQGLFDWPFSSTYVALLLQRCSPSLPFRASPPTSGAAQPPSAPSCPAGPLALPVTVPPSAPLPCSSALSASELDGTAASSSCFPLPSCSAVLLLTLPSSILSRSSSRCLPAHMHRQRLQIFVRQIIPAPTLSSARMQQQLLST